MNQGHSGPIAIIGGQMYPVTAAQCALARAGKSMGHIPGFSAPSPAAATPLRAAAPKPAANDSPETLRKAAAFDAIMAEKSRNASRENMLKQVRNSGVDPKARTMVAPVRKADANLDGRALARASMARLVRAQGLEPVNR